MTEQLERRVTKLEDEMPEAIAVAQDARDHASMANILADGAFTVAQDVRATLRAHTRSLNALRETQVEHGQRLDRLEQKVDGLGRKVDEGFTMMSLGMSKITALITNIERG
ncbi:hypothetical protein LWP59_40160 [Amycolatopsis acidiphila]|uniref:Uncharacterized protein n=1 Tax=Amycolatopsis acidiphila TaxID=715473 RepID=A0A558A2D2_9PSEU|nr:hypothetical protein [Amycolatopsis acidiphila]TVT18405.1 hypothetical protein FNH06_27895 [Amycolatopsis acidiphila]UIJ60115.1 hypothetical protein LWP59_40160 [Amycolatopsis acidiphila]GHG61299.1 hypothetical protein GCM10017788_15840 [Amycolatopsis acidiphila]